MKVWRGSTINKTDTLFKEVEVLVSTVYRIFLIASLVMVSVSNAEQSSNLTATMVVVNQTGAQIQIAGGFVIMGRNTRDQRVPVHLRGIGRVPANTVTNNSNGTTSVTENFRTLANDARTTFNLSIPRATWNGPNGWLNHYLRHEDANLNTGTHTRYPFVSMTPFPVHPSGTNDNYRIDFTSFDQETRTITWTVRLAPQSECVSELDGEDVEDTASSLFDIDVNMCSVEDEFDWLSLVDFCFEDSGEIIECWELDSLSDLPVDLPNDIDPGSAMDIDEGIYSSHIEPSSGIDIDDSLALQ